MAISEAMDLRSFASNTLGRYIFGARRRKRISLILLADMLRLLDRFFIWKWEKGLQAIPVSRLSKMITILELSEDKVVETIFADVRSKLISLLEDSAND